MDDTTPDAFNWLHQLAGRFIVFDGPDGSGKSSQFRRFHEFVEDHGGPRVCEVREPGGTGIGEQIRDILLDPSNRAADLMDLRTEMLLFMASRAQLVAERIRPARENGELVIADRFVSSTLAYQGTAGGLDPEDILAVARVACGNAWPDLVLVFDVDEQTAASRLNPLLDRMEQKGAEFHRRVRQGFLDQAQSDPDGYGVIDGTRNEEQVFSALCDQVRHRLAS